MASERVQRRIDRLLDQIEDAVDQLDWATVRDRAQAVLALDRENRDALTFLEAAEFALNSAPGSLSTHPPESEPVLTPVPLSDNPTSFANGRYQVKLFLGEGGKKMVYLAHDTLLDREVAFALIKTEGLDEAGRSRIQREAQAMGRLGSHSHIVTVFDLGQEDHQPYMVTELMGGGDVEGMIEKADDHRVPLEQAVKIAQEACQGLQFAHGRGIVHRDLKPGNVWLTGDGIAKIGDFGLAVALDRSRLTTEGMMVGTVSYMPPEQAMGGEVTPRSDLYSLGAMLYEMVTGRPPFLGDDSVAIIGQHINTPPVAPTWHNGQCPRALDALILRLLAKDPSERPESATDVLSALDAIDLVDVGAMHASPLQDDPHALDSLAGGVFVGRQREMGDLKAALEDALSGRGRLVTLVGEPGIGKTRTAQELATYAGLRGAQVLWGRCYEDQGVPPYWPWVQAIRSYVRDRDPERLRSEMGSGASDIAEIVSELRERLPDLQLPPDLQPEQARFRLFDSITTFMKTASRTQPLVLMLDDLHWADKPSLLLLEFLARELAGARLLVVGTYRDVELSRQHPLAETLGELNRSAAGGLQRVLLRGLALEDIARFIEIAAGITPPQGLVSAVHTQTEGNPLFVTEVVRLLVQDRELTADDGRGSSRTAPTGTERDSWTVRIPEGVTEVIGRRLNRLSQRCNETLTIASVIGREFELRQLAPLIEDVSEDRMLEVLEEALAARVLEELPSTVGRYQFTHALIQETLNAELSLTRRVRLHARIAEALETLYGANAEAHSAELAHHFTEAQTILGPEKLVHYSLLAGERALATYANEEALAQFQRGLGARNIPITGSESAKDAESASLLFGYGRAQVGTLGWDRLTEAVTSLTRAFDYYAGAGHVDQAVTIAGYPLPAGPSGVVQLIGRALELVAPNSHQAGNLLPQYGLALSGEMGDYQGAQRAFDEAMVIARRENDVNLELKTLAGAARADLFNLSWRKCIENGLQAIDLARRADAPYSEADARWCTIQCLWSFGDLGAAKVHAEAMLELAETLRDRIWLASAYLGGQIPAQLEGLWSVARDFSDRGLLLSPGDARHLGPRLRLEYEVGDFTKGHVYLERLVEAMRESPPLPGPQHSFPASMIPMIARIDGVMDHLDIAVGAAEVILSSSAAIPMFSTHARVGLAMLAVVRADSSAANDHYQHLVSISGTVFNLSGIAVDRLLGLLAHTMDNFDKAAEHFEDSLGFCRKAGYRPELAWTCCDYADMLQERNNEGDRAKAMALLDESLAISNELGMRPLLERVLSRRDILGA